VFALYAVVVQSTSTSPDLIGQPVPAPQQSSRWQFSPNVGVGIGWCIHFFTGLGIVCGVLSIDAIAAGNAKQALFWLIVAQVIDDIDGPIARACGVRVLVPLIDGYVLDLVIDFVTCVVAPVAFIHRFHLLPLGPTGFLCEGLILLSAALWFSRTDMYTDDHWFRGFPAPWNMVVTVMFLMNTHPGTNAVFAISMSLLSLSNVQFAHGTQASFGESAPSLP